MKIKEIIKDTLNNINELFLHDAEIKEVVCNYYEHRVTIPIKLPFPQNEKKMLSFEGVLYSDISYYEPWGQGYYIASITYNEDISNFSISANNSLCFSISIELNSGDKINIIADKMICKDEE